MVLVGPEIGLGSNQLHSTVFGGLRMGLRACRRAEATHGAQTKPGLRTRASPAPPEPSAFALGLRDAGRSNGPNVLRSACVLHFPQARNTRRDV